MAVALFVVREVPRSTSDVTNCDGKPLGRFRPITFCPSLADKLTDAETAARLPAVFSF